MFFERTMSFKPSSQSIIAKNEPSHFIGRFFNTITGGMLTEEEERQTYTALGIMQDFNRVFRSVGINDIVSLSKDGEICYLDEAEVEDDLQQAMSAFANTLNGEKGCLFKDLHLVVTHKYEGLRLYLDLSILRVHAVDQDPISLQVHGLIEELEQRDGESKEALEDRIKIKFQEHGYQQYVDGLRAKFDAFTDSLADAIKEKLRITDITKSNRQKVMRAGKDEGFHDLRNSSHHPVMGGTYHTPDNTVMYAFLWMMMMESVAVSAEDFHVVDGDGDTLHHFDETTEVEGLALFDQEVDPNRLNSGTMELSSEALAESSSWLGDFDTGASDSFVSGDSGGASCSSCGGGCGGGCGGA